MSAETKPDAEKPHEGEEEGEAMGAFESISGDVLQTVLAHVPLVDLVAACHVSKSWNHAVFSSLRRVNQIKPWLVVHARSRRSPLGTTVRAYDPRSHVWIEIVRRRSPSRHVPAAPLRSSHSSLLYALSPFKFSFSVDPLHLVWRHVDPPRVWRSDPVVAILGKRVVVAGGVCDFEDDGLAVEILDVETGAWSACQSMPLVFKDSAAAMWLSVAANSEKIYVADKRSGTAYSFDPYTCWWTGPFDLRPDRSDDVYTRVIFCLGDDLLMLGVTGDEGETMDVKVWEISGEWREKFKLIGVMPKACVKKLRREGCFGALTSISVNAVGGMVFVHNEAESREIVAAEMADGSLCGWRTVVNVAASDRSVLAERLVFTCSNVRLGDLRRALREEECEFCVICRCIANGEEQM